MEVNYSLLKEQKTKAMEIIEHELKSEYGFGLFINVNKEKDQQQEQKQQQHEHLFQYETDKQR